MAIKIENQPANTPYKMTVQAPGVTITFSFDKQHSGVQPITPSTRAKEQKRPKDPMFEHLRTAMILAVGAIRTHNFPSTLDDYQIPDEVARAADQLRCWAARVFLREAKYPAIDPLKNAFKLYSIAKESAFDEPGIKELSLSEKNVLTERLRTTIQEALNNPLESANLSTMTQRASQKSHR